MAEVRKGTACSWGVGIDTTTDYGRVINWTHTKQAEEAMLKEQNGDVATFILHGINETATVEIVPEATTYATPAIGDTLAITDSLGDGATSEGIGSGSGGTASKYYITGVNATQTIGDAAKLSLTVKRFPAISTA